MKKYFNLFLLVVLSMTVSVISSCSDDPVIYPVEEEMAGNYKGTLKVNVDGIDLATMPQKIAITKAAQNNFINLSLNNFSFMGIVVGDVNLNDCPLVQEGETYTFKGTTKLDIPSLTADVNAVGTISKGSVKINMDINADLGGVQQAVKVFYEGNRLKGTESAEAKILSFTFDKNVAAVDSLVVGTPVIDEAKKTITFMVADTAKAEHLAILVPTIEVSEKAVLTPGSGVAQDFSNGKEVVYTVEAEDGTVATYKASVFGRTKVYNFNDWTVDKTQSDENMRYPMLVDKQWANCNQAVMFVKAFGSMAQPDPIKYTGGWAIEGTDDAYDKGGKAASMTSVDTFGSDNMLGQKVPKVTAASMFLGTFNSMDALFGGPMSTTKFGIPYEQEPVKVTGFYKYTPGKEFYNANKELVEGKVDECSMSAVLYEVNDYKETLDGSNIYTSDKIVAQAMFKSNKTVTEYTPFELELKYTKKYDPTKKYKFTVILSASADGAAYNAAVGSKLIVDEVFVINK